MVLSYWERVGSGGDLGPSKLSILITVNCSEIGPDRACNWGHLRPRPTAIQSFPAFLAGSSGTRSKKPSASEGGWDSPALESRNGQWDSCTKRPLGKKADPAMGKGQRSGLQALGPGKLVEKSTVVGLSLSSWAHKRAPNLGNWGRTGDMGKASSDEAQWWGQGVQSQAGETDAPDNVFTHSQTSVKFSKASYFSLSGSELPHIPVVAFCSLSPCLLWCWDGWSSLGDTGGGICLIWV
jgi:hypothetical protein